MGSKLNGNSSNRLRSLPVTGLSVRVLNPPTLVGESFSHLISRRQVQTDKELAIALQAVKDADFFPEERVRLCVIGDGAPWIRNRIKESCPDAKEVLDYYHCAEHSHEPAHARYGKGGIKARERVEATLCPTFS